MDRQPTCTNCGRHTYYLLIVERENGVVTDECSDCAAQALSSAEKSGKRVVVNA